MDVYSGHADRRELLAWVRLRLPISRGVFVTHGEEEALTGLRKGIVELGLPSAHVIVPRLDQTFLLHPPTISRPVSGAVPGRLDPKADALVAGQDWHNDYARFVLDLQHKLRRTAEDRSRQKLLKKLAKTLG